MDELVRHCLRELSFDGDLGCDVSRLRDFIAGFYSSQGGQDQCVDDAFCAFVWSVVVQQPSVRVGTLPPGMISEVYIAPQTSARRKAAAKGQELTECVPPSLQIVADAQHKHLDDLKRECGDNLRIAVDPETSFAAITGSHIRPSKLSPMVYSALQLITRGREDGITTVELGRKTNYDQKTCFYLIKQLVELGLIIKARRGGVGNHTCIHRYFVERSSLWQQILEEEARGNEPVTDGRTNQSLVTDETVDQANPSQASFDPIDSRHLSSLPLVKNRIIKLLNASKDHIHQSNNLLMTIGFVNPTKTDRRFFQTRLRELIQQGVVERVLVPSSRTPDRKIKCIRLVTSDNQLPEGAVVVRQDMDEDEKDPSLHGDVSAGRNEVKANLTIHKQVSNMLEEAGPSGLTLNEMCASLGNFDKRTIELLLTRASNSRPPAHLADLATVDLMETYGRERRHRYFTLAAYRRVMTSEQLQDTTTTAADIDLSRVGDFAALDPKRFYTTATRLRSHQDSFKDMTAAKGKKRKRTEGSDEEQSEPLSKPKRGRPRKVSTPGDAITSTPKKRGRPRKDPSAISGEVPSAAGSSSKRSTKAHTEGDVSMTVDDVQMSSAQTPVSSSGTIISTEQPVSPLAAVPSSGVQLATSRPTSLQGVSDTQFYHSPQPTPRRSSKRTRSIVLDVGQRSITEPSDAAVNPSSLEKGNTQDPSPITVVQKEAAITASAVVDIVASEDHEGLTPPAAPRPSKRSRTNGGAKSRSNINISSLRRENELLRVIENMGGIVNVHSKDIFEAHTALLDTMAQAKEPTSAPVGTRLDKRTAESTLRSLENRERIKMLKTSLVAPSGVSRPACLVYLSDMSQEKVNDFLRQLSQSMSSAAAGQQLEQNSSVNSTPRPDNSAVTREEIGIDLEKARERVKRKRRTEDTQSLVAKLALRKKAEEARVRREQDWDNLLSRIHPEPVKGTLAARIRAVRSRFMQSTTTKDQSHWENEIQGAIRETQLASKRITSQSRPRLDLQARGVVAAPPSVVPNPPEKSIELLISQQGLPISPTASVKKKGKAREENEASRRSRFHWTREFDELARDASAIIRARCRASRLDLSAFDQVFPAVPRNSVRQRITHLRESAAEDLYMKRLEDQWYTIWLQYRGTTYLPDEDPSSSSNFSLVNHIEFLRKHVDKNALRVGFVEREAPSKLAKSVTEIYEFYDVEEDVVSTPVWDFMWGTTVEEGREKQFRSQAFTREPDGVCEAGKNDKVQLAEAAMKMVFGTPAELYDSENAVRLLRSVGDEWVSLAKSNLLQRGVLSKLVRDPKKPKPGRTLKISDTNLNSLGGPFPRDLLQDAISLEDVAFERVVDEMEWPLLASEGDIAALLQLVSEDQVDFIVDSSQTRTARQKVDWNSKRADDEDIETSIRMKFSHASAQGTGGNQDQTAESPTVEPDSVAQAQEAHEKTLDGKEAACAIRTESGLVNCSACIHTAFSSFTSSLRQSDHDLARRVLDHVRGSKENGVHKASCLALEVGQEQHTLELIHKMTLTTPPILLWSYFNAPVVVAGDYCGALGVELSDEPLMLITPRRWLDLHGYRLDSAWRIGQQAVTGIIFQHPGISQVELRWRLRAVYDRQEIIDLLSSLQEDGALEYRTNARVETVQNLPGWLKTLDDEEAVFWFVAKNHHWYQS